MIPNASQTKSPHVTSQSLVYNKPHHIYSISSAKGIKKENTCHSQARIRFILWILYTLFTSTNLFNNIAISQKNYTVS